MNSVALHITILYGAVAATLELEAVGRIKIRSEHATVDAKALGAIFEIETDTTNGPVHSSERIRGLITFEGSLAGGSHSLWATGPVSLRLPADAAFKLDAVTNGSVTSSLKVTASGPTNPSRLVGMVGVTPRSSIHVRARDGPITIEKQP